MQAIGLSEFEVRCNCFKRRILGGVSGDVGFPHMSVGPRIEAFGEFPEQCMRHSL